MKLNATVATDGVELHFSKTEAELLIDALRTLANSRRFAFKEPQEDVRQMHPQLFELAERVESQIKRAFGK